MDKKAWTARGFMKDVDRLVIQAVVEKDPIAARIFVTGEVAESYIGDEATRLLININDTLYRNGASTEPLFVQTRDSTVRMTRFDPEFVWRCFNPETLVQLVEAEAARLHIDMDVRGMEYFDFYEEMTAVLAKKVDSAVPIAWKDSDLDVYQNAVYLSCLLLFHKPGFLDIPVAEYFAQPKVAEFMETVDYRPLTATEFGNLEILREEYGEIQALTNPELNFIVGLYERKRL